MSHARIVGDGLNGKYRQTALLELSGSKGADGNACPHHGQKRAKTYSSLMHQHASSPRKRVNVNFTAAPGAVVASTLLLRGAWNAAFIDECRLFPFGKYDDQVAAQHEGRV